MKKILYTLLSFCVLISFAACTPSSIEPESDTTSEQVDPKHPNDNGDSDKENGNSDVNGDTDPQDQDDSQNQDDNETNINNDDPQSQNGDDQEDDGITIAPIQVMSPSVGAETGAVSLSGDAGEYGKVAGSFALKLLPFLYKNESFVASPLSIQMALSMAAEGAVGQTLGEMLEVLGFPGLDGLGAYSKALIEQLPSVDLSVKLQLADAMIAREDVGVLPAYKDAIEGNYYAPVVSMPFSNPAKVREAVNDWCRRNTNGMIPSILDDEGSPDALSLAYILNALYFKADWSNPFDSQYQVVKGQPFRVDGGRVQVDYLYSDEYLLYADMGSYHVAFRPLGKKEKYDIAVILPKDDDGLEALLKELPALDISNLRAAAGFNELYFRIPAFDLTSSYSLENQLRAMGIRRAFDGNAQFDNMFDGVSSCISKVLHKARIDLNSGGIEGAAVTSVEMADTEVSPDENAPLPIEFYADHPFVYIISESTSGTILFEGVFRG